MSQSTGDKKRNLISRMDDHSEICLSDLIDYLANLSTDLSKLEYFDIKSTSEKVAREMRLYKVEVDKFYKRMKLIKEEISKVRNPNMKNNFPISTNKNKNK
jgi:hypothetical protein